MKEWTKAAIVILAATGVASAGAYKLPEQSLNSMALGAAYVAHTTEADSAYFNPANMAFLREGHLIDAAATLVHLSSISYRLIPPYSGESEDENIFVSTLHYVSESIGDFRWGVSIVAPGGLSRKWESPYQRLYAEEFTLENIELNPVFSYKLNDNFAVGGGLRVVYSKGTVRSNGGTIAPIAREMKGDTVEFGYNVALSYRPTEDIVLAATYRSKIDLDEEGHADLSFMGMTQRYGADVSVPLPAALNIALSKTWDKTFTLEFVYERTYWSAYKALDFNYDTALPAPLVPIFDAPLDRSWKDTDTFRIGATAELGKITAMFGFAIDETPVPIRTIGFELPDSDAKIFSMGFRYRQSEHLSWGLAFLYDDKESLTLPAGVAENKVLHNGGSFDDAAAYLITFGISYEY